MQPKSLDLSREEHYNMLACHNKPVNIVKKVNLHEELPPGVRQVRDDKKKQEVESYNINEMWGWLEANHGQAVAGARPFKYTKEKEKI